MYRYAVTLKRAREGGYVVGLPAFPEIVTQGETINEAGAAARDALDEAIANRIVQEMPLPRSDARAATRHVAEASPFLTMKASLYEAMRARGVTKTRLARLLDVGETEVRRMLDPRHATKFQRLVEALRALGAEVRVEVTARSRTGGVAARAGAA